MVIVSILTWSLCYDCADYPCKYLPNVGDNIINNWWYVCVINWQLETLLLNGSMIMFGFQAAEHDSDVIKRLCLHFTSIKHKPISILQWCFKI